MIIGIGIDVCEIARMKDALDRHGDRMWNRILCDSEQTLLKNRADRAGALAGRFAVKEALVKAMNGAVGVGWHDLEVVGGPRTPPTMVLHGPALELARKLGVRRVHVSITHDAGVAAAMAVLEGSIPCQGWEVPL